ncbi:hypothetical protein [Kaistella palustris]|uniref:hypothetical protein n=1 Tax=Kaistella palustris TaxID=493376 RepID=UPI0004165F05|nr:hypothetical protein [Kaistella palustris]
MKKVLAIAFIGGLILASCAKKEVSNDVDTVVADSSAVMTQDSAMVDSAAVVAPVATDSTMVK